MLGDCKEKFQRTLLDDAYFRFSFLSREHSTPSSDSKFREGQERAMRCVVFSGSNNKIYYDAESVPCSNIGQAWAICRDVGTTPYCDQEPPAKTATITTWTVCTWEPHSGWQAGSTESAKSPRRPRSNFYNVTRMLALANAAWKGKGHYHSIRGRGHGIDLARDDRLEEELWNRGNFYNQRFSLVKSEGCDGTIDLRQSSD